MKSALILASSLIVLGCQNSVYAYRFCDTYGHASISIDQRNRMVYWTDVQYGYGNDCAGRCLLGFSEFVDFLDNKSLRHPDELSFAITASGSELYTLHVIDTTPVAFTVEALIESGSIEPVRYVECT